MTSLPDEEHKWLRTNDEYAVNDRTRQYFRSAVADDLRGRLGEDFVPANANFSTLIRGQQLALHRLFDPAVDTAATLLAGKLGISPDEAKEKIARFPGILDGGNNVFPRAISELEKTQQYVGTPLRNMTMEP